MRTEVLQRVFFAAACVGLSFELYPIAAYLTSDLACPSPLLYSSFGLLTEIQTIAVGLLALLSLRRALRNSCLLILAFLLLSLPLADQRFYSNHLFLLSIYTSFYAARAFVEGERYLLATQMQLSIVYFFSSLSKINTPFLSGAFIWGYWIKSGPFAVPEIFQVSSFFALVAFSTILAELLLAFLLWIPRYKSSALVAGVIFHLGLFATAPEGQFIQLFVFCCTVFSIYCSLEILTQVQAGSLSPVKKDKPGSSSPSS
jgi:hypothetical protein